MPWSAKLLKPIVPPKGMAMVTLSDARKYLLSLPEVEQTNSLAQQAFEAVRSAAEGRGPLLQAQTRMNLLLYGPRSLPKPVCLSLLEPDEHEAVFTRGMKSK